MANPLDLSSAAVQKFWIERHDSLLYRIIASLESVQYWTHDGDPDVEAALEELAAAMSELNSFEISDEGSWVDVLAHLKLSRSLRIMQFLDQLRPGTASKLLVFSEVEGKNTGDTPGLFLNQNLIFERMQLLYRVFSKDRMETVLAAVEGAGA